MSLAPETRPSVEAEAAGDTQTAVVHIHDHLEEAHGLPYHKFVPAVLLQIGLAIAAVWFFLPNEFASEVARPGQVILATLALGIPVSLFEYLYHRYLLHSAVLPFIGSMHRAHAEHHGLTYVKAPVTPRDPEKLVEVDSAYPVEHHHQEDSQMFPLFSLSIFYVVFFGFIGLPFKALFPAAPVYLPMISIVTASYVLYEVWHAILHLSYEKKWKPALDHPSFGAITRFVYSFHQMHHWRPSTNLAVVGFWGIALWDHLFGTHVRPKHLPHDKSLVNYHDVVGGKPRFPIAQLDKVQPAMYKWSRSVEKAMARVFLKRQD